jgi:hypothetical protein
MSALHSSKAKKITTEFAGSDKRFRRNQFPSSASPHALCGVKRYTEMKNTIFIRKLFLQNER